MHQQYLKDISHVCTVCTGGAHSAYVQSGPNTLLRLPGQGNPGQTDNRFRQVPALHVSKLHGSIYVFIAHR